MTALNYTAGTVSLTNGSAVVTGIGTAWQIALIVGGTIYVEAAGNPLPIDSVDSDTQITAAIVWAGATGEYNYVLRRSTAYDEQVAKNAEIFARLVAELEAGTIWKYDAAGDTAGKAFYDTRPKGFSYLDTSGAQPALWVKASNDEADWAGPFSYGVGPVGPAPSLTFSPVVTGEPGTPASVDVTGDDPVNLAFTIPAGVQGIRWRGAYDAGTSYQERDGVRDNGSTWIALQDTIGNAPPVLPVTSNAFWELVAAKGLDGTGTGDVVGPAGAIDGRIAIFNGTTGKLIAVGPAPFSGAYGDLSGLPALGNAAALDVGNTAGTVAAGDDARFSVGGKNDAILALEVADLKGARLGMIGGIADAFDDETGIDGPGSTNAVYDASLDLYRPSFIAGTDQTATHTGYTAAGNTVSASSSLTGYEAWRAFDKLVGNASGLNTWATNSILTGWLQYQFDAAKTIRSYTVRSLNGYAARAPKTWTLLGSNTGAFSGEQVALDTRTNEINWAAGGEVRTYSITAPSAAYAYYRLNITAQNGDPNYLHIDEVTLLSATVINNMTLASVATTAAAVPSLARIAVQTVESEAITINTDLVAKVSRDGGTTWTAATLALSTNLNGVKIYEASGIDISAQPSGVSMKWRVETLNNKNVAISGVVLQWSE